MAMANASESMKPLDSFVLELCGVGRTSLGWLKVRRRGLLGRSPFKIRGLGHVWNDDPDVECCEVARW
jgi:hypothetical protein